MTDINQQIKNDIENNKILIFMKGNRMAPQCGFSAAVVDVFTKLGVAFETKDVLADSALRDGIKAYSNWPTIPQVYINGEFIGGCDITREMYKNGELQKLVENLK